MTQIAATDSALVRLIESCDFPGVTVLSAPHEWDGGFVQRLIGETPALLVAFLGAEPYEPDTQASTVNRTCEGRVGVVYRRSAGTARIKRRGGSAPAPDST